MAWIRQDVLYVSIGDLTQPTISHHLKVLREAGVSDSERRGSWVYYRLVPATLTRMAALLATPDPGSRRHGEPTGRRSPALPAGGGPVQHEPPAAVGGSIPALTALDASRDEVP